MTPPCHPPLRYGMLRDPFRVLRDPQILNLNFGRLFFTWFSDLERVAVRYGAEIIRFR